MKRKIIWNKKRIAVYGKFFGDERSTLLGVVDTAREANDLMWKYSNELERKH